MLTTWSHGEGSGSSGHCDGAACVVTLRRAGVAIAAARRGVQRVRGWGALLLVGARQGLALPQALLFGAVASFGKLKSCYERRNGNLPSLRVA
jgi:hypothetical protein